MIEASEAQERVKPYFTVEEMLAIPMFSQPNVSMDGTKIAYVQRRTDWEENRYVNHVFVYDRSSKQKYQITSGTNDSFNPKWSPDGRMLAFVTKQSSGSGQSTTEGQNEEANQLCVITGDNRAGIQVTSLKAGVTEYLWASDGSGFYFLSEMKQEKLDKRREQYGEIEYVDIDDSTRQTLYFVHLEKAISERSERYALPKDLQKQSLTGTGPEQNDGDNPVSQAVPSDSVKTIISRPDLHIQDFDVSPTGETIVFSAAPSTNLEDVQQTSMYLLDINSEKVTKVPTKGVVNGPVHFSPDGQQFVYTRQTGDEKMFRNCILEVYSLASHDITSIPIGIDENLDPVAWTTRGILVSWQNRTNRWLEFVQLNGAREALAVGDGLMAYNASISRDGCRAAWIQARMNEPADIVVDGERITDNYTLYQTKTLSHKQIFQWRSSDGVEIEGILSLPADFDEGKHYPLLVVIHGGPTWASFPAATDNRYYPMEQFAEKGCIILEPNYRGSSGYGNSFRGLNEGNLGVGDYDDVISGVDALIDLGMADKDRVGVMGWSQGGYISAFCTTYSNRFRAVSVGAGISNWMTYYVNTDIHPFTRHYLGDNPWNDAETYAKTSPMTYIKNASTPTLIQHGSQDSRVPVPNAFELYQGLRDVGVEVKLVIYKGMEHGSNKPGWNRAIMHQNLAWFSHHMLGEGLSDFWLV